MSNLGEYQWITTTAKKVGGPINLLLLAGATGAVIYKSSEVVIKQSIRIVKARRKTMLAIEATKTPYEVTSVGRSNEGLDFMVGDQFRVLETDGDSVLIEKIGDNDNPYFVSAELLRRISNFEG